MKYRTNKYLLQPRQSCVACFQTLYGIGKVKSYKMNCFLLHHPMQAKFTQSFRTIAYSSYPIDYWGQIRKDDAIRISVKHHLELKVMTFCYQAYRLFQDLPTKGQRTKCNGKSHVNNNPFKVLLANTNVYKTLQVEYKKRELFLNGRFSELKAYTEAQEQTKKMIKADIKQKKNAARQQYMKNLKKHETKN